MKIEYYLPLKILNNLILSENFPGFEASKIEAKIGIRERHIAADDETALDMAFNASQKVLEDYDKSQIGFILFCTQSPDYFLPTTACILQDRLGLPTNIGALDFNLGCSGFVYGLSIAKGLINSNICTNILLITSETYSKHIHPKDRANRSIFGDAATATILNFEDVNKIFNFELGTDGKGENNLIVKNGGFRFRNHNKSEEWTDDAGNFRSDNHLYMNGPEIFNFTIESIPGVIKRVLEKNHLTIDEIDYFIFHQANKYMLDYLRKKIQIPLDKFYNNMLFTGNTVSSTIPIALKDCLDNKIVKQGDKVLLIGFGVGYSWGATIIKI
jgi:3-oxoacyl-[acyl-carrier-protein] synthase III